MQQQYTLGSTERLKSRKRIEQLFREGSSFSNFPFRVLYSKVPPEEHHPGNALQAAFSVSVRNFKKAVHRNRIKRLMREAWRLQKHTLQQQVEQGGQQWAVFLIYTGKELPDYKMVFEKTGLLLNRLCEKTMLS